MTHVIKFDENVTKHENAKEIEKLAKNNKTNEYSLEILNLPAQNRVFNKTKNQTFITCISNVF